MSRFCYSFIFALLFASCNKEEMTIEVPETGSDLVHVTFNVATDKSKISYDGPNGANSLFYPTWHTGDPVTVLADLATDIKAPFSITNDGSTTTLSGDISTWNEETDVYAIYPHRDDTYNFKNGKFTVNMSAQTINGVQPSAGAASSMPNAVLLAKLENVTNTKDNNLSSDDMFFRQAMSFLRFTLVHEGHKLRRITLKSSTGFYEQAKISLTDDGIAYDYTGVEKAEEVYSDNITSDPSGTSLINFALFPTELDDLTIEIQTISNNESYIYTKTIANPPLFERNKFTFFNSPLSLESFEEEVVGAIDLGSINENTPVPAGNNWVIESSTTINQNTVRELKNLIIRSGKKISLKFPNVTTIEGSCTLWRCPNLESLEFPDCKIIGDHTFAGCPDLKKVVMPALIQAGNYTFYDSQNPIDTEVEFIAGTKTDVHLKYGKDGTWIKKDKPLQSGWSLSRVHITLGNVGYSSEEYRGEFLINSVENTPVYFGSITWQ